MNDIPGLVVVGHGPAGASAANAFRELDVRTPVTIVSGEGVTCYARPRLPEVVSGQVAPEAIRLHPDDWYASHHIQVRLCQAAVQVAPVAHTVTLDDGTVLPYRALILATGAAPVQPPIAGLPLDHVFVLRTLEDAVKIRTQATGKQRAVLVGGGLLGLEAGYALTRLGLQVTVVETAPWLLPRQVDREGSELLQEKLRSLGFDFQIGVSVAQIHSTPGGVWLRLNTGVELQGDLTVLSAGIRPRTELAAGAQISLNHGILVDDRMQTSQPDIWAAGDVAEWQGVVAGLWAASQGMGRVAGINAAGGTALYSGSAPSTKLKIAGVEVCSQGNIHLPQATLVQRHDADYWAKLFLVAGRVVGSIQIGKTTGAVSLKKLIDQQLDVSEFASNVLQDGFDFERIPGFKK